MNRSLAMVALCGAAACSSAADRLALPPSEGARALVWIVTTPEGSRAFAIDVDLPFDPSDYAVSLDAAASAEIHAVTYARPLAALGLSPGELRLDPTGQPLPQLSDAHVWRRSIAPEGAAPWTTVEAWPALLAELRVVRASPCGVFTIEETLPLPPDLSVMQAILRFSDGRILLAAASGYTGPPTLFPLGDGVIEASLGRLPVAAIHAWDTETIDHAWVVVTPTTSAIPELWRLDARGARVEVVPAPQQTAAPTAVAWQDGVLYALVPGGLARWDGARWERLFDTAALLVDGTNPKLRPLSADEVWFLMPQGATVGHYLRGEGVQIFPFDPESPVGRDEVDARTLIHHPELGPVVGTSGGTILTLAPWPLGPSSTWVPIDRVDTMHSAGVLVAFPGGLIAAGFDGYLAELHEGFGFCPFTSLPGLNVYQFVSLGEDRWLASGTAHGAPGTRVLEVRWARPR